MILIGKHKLCYNVFRMLEEYKLEELVEPAIRWYKENKRDLPWRVDKDPYHIWVSEIMLQQTRVEAVKGYYERFLHRLPTIEALAKCPEDELLKLWEGLGYYNRVRNMQRAAKEMMESYEGNFPRTYEEILALPGIGNYTAGAIASIAFGLPHPAVDGNVLRILCRAAEDDRDIKKESTKKEIQALLTPVMPKDASGEFNQALMEIGACVCVPNGQPLCEACPWKNLCLTNKHNTYEKYPVKSKPLKRRIEKKTILLVMDGNRILIQKRPAKGLLAGLYEFPGQDGHINRKDVVAFARDRGLDPILVETLPAAKHIFSHVEWHMIGYLIRVADLSDAPTIAGNLLVSKEKIQSEYAIPSAFKTYADCVQLELGKNAFHKQQ